MKKIIVTFLFFVFLACNIFTAFAVDYGKVTITEIQPFGMNSSSSVSSRHGYAEYRFLVQNRDTSASHRVKIEMTHQTMGASAASYLTTDTIEVAAGSHVTLRLFQPPVKDPWGVFDLNVYIDGRCQSDIASIASDHLIRRSSSSTGNDATVCFSQQTPATIRDFFERRSTLPPADAAKKAGGGAATTGFTLMPPTQTIFAKYSNVPVEEWSDLWVAYSRFDCVVMTADEWGGLVTRKPAVINAIKRYVETGGMLVILGRKWEIPQEWESIFKSGSDDSNDIERTIVCGKVFVLGQTDAEVANNAGFFDNIIQQIDSAAKTETQRINLAQNDNVYGRGYGSGGGESTVSRMNNILPVIEKYGVNIKLILVLIIVFAVLIGPVNVFVLRSLNRRIWLIWTVPATSLIASFIVLIASFLSEGFLSQSSSATCTILDQRRGSAVTFGAIGYYSTFSPGNFNFSTDTELTPFLDNSGGTLELRITSSGNQLLSGGGWILPRVPAYFSFRKNQMLQKLNVAFNWTDANKPTATNGLGVKIDLLVVCSSEGELFEVRDLEPGAQKVLTKAARPKSSFTEVAFYSKLRLNQQDALASGHFDSMLNNQELCPGSYSAVIKEANPFVEPGLPNMKPFTHKTIILGLY
ncbi:MAG: hypothetical protein LBB88_00015 [Planctomycetaceae bacterium]|nr:hypothetical protein [Planctomycetaceae bacterium]